MASPGPAAPPVAPEAPGEGGSGAALDALSRAVGKKRWRPVSSLSAFSYIPARREEPPELSYFYRAPKTENVSTYDSLFKRMEGYNEHHHRCDRTHAKGHGLNINEEDVKMWVHLKGLPVLVIVYDGDERREKKVKITEMERPVAVLSSSEYGRRINKPIEQPTKEYARFNYVQADFYNKNGITCLLEASSPSLDLC